MKTLFTLLLVSLALISPSCVQSPATEDKPSPSELPADWNVQLVNSHEFKVLDSCLLSVARKEVNVYQDRLAGKHVTTTELQQIYCERDSLLANLEEMKLQYQRAYNSE